MSKLAVMLSLVLLSPVVDEPGRPPSADAAPPSKSAPDEKKKKPDFPPLDEVTKEMTKVVSTVDGVKPLFDLYKDKKTGKLLAVLPANFDETLYMVASTVSGGNSNAGVMGPTEFFKWRKINKQMALVAPNLHIRTDGDQQAKDSMEQLYTGRVITSLPIVAMTEDKRPVIELGALATTEAGKFFREEAMFGGGIGKINPKLASLTKAKAFPQNVIFEYEVPQADGRLIRLTQNISKLEGTPGYKPRNADPRVGYFYDFHLDFARTVQQDITSRYISRWCLEKADPDLKLSPPKKPIIWYIEHTTPIRFRRYVREGILMWNEAYRRVGLDDALVVYQQDTNTKEHMNKDPEDARYNFFRWNASEQGYAIGPSRSNPLTGEILDADVVWHQGLTRALRGMIERVTEDFVAQAFGPENLAWFEKHPNWDPRIRLASPINREKRLRELEAGIKLAATSELKSPEHPWMRSAMSERRNTACSMGSMLSLEIGLADAAFMAGMLETGDVDLLDGLPENYLGPMIRYIAAHEVGHCLGLQHNMAGSTWQSLEDINSPGFDAPSTASVMDYISPNINHEIGEIQGPYITDRIGKYDMWAIEFGYGDEDKVEEVLSRVNEPGNLFISQLAIFFGGDPRNNTWDIGSDSLAFAKERFGIIRELRSTLLEKQVKEGESWRQARRRLSMLTGVQLQALRLASVWIGGSFINNNFKGDPDERPPNTDVPGSTQREALQLMMDNSFEDDAYGITPELLRHLGREYWWDPLEWRGITNDPNFPVNDFVSGIQATSLTLMMNPTKLRRIYDNEFRANGTEDVFTLSELLTTVTDAIWRECSENAGGKHSVQEPMISGFRRSLQREHVQRLIDLALLQDSPGAAMRTVGTLATQELTRIEETAGKGIEDDPDDYTRAHLADIRTRIGKAREAAYVIPTS